jgi:ATP-dependent DNA helicase DinG
MRRLLGGWLVNKRIDGAFPYPSYRPHQRDIIETAASTLFEGGEYDTVLIDAPTGVGKSGINTTLAQLANTAFYTTPQKKLRHQLENDADLNRQYAVLRGRNDYRCTESLSPKQIEASDQDQYPTCAECSVYRSRDRSCTTRLNCPYWNGKKQAMQAQTAVVTFAYLIIDGHLPVSVEDDQTGETKRISFADRDLLVVDECHKLEEQTAGLFAGFTVSDETLPDAVYNGAADRLHSNETRFAATRDVLDDVYQRASQVVPAQGTWDTYTDEERQCATFCQRFRYCRDEVDNHGRTWVVSVSHRKGAITVKPVRVDKFLREHVWSRADKRVLSTATPQHGDNPAKWLSRLGLDPARTKIIRKPMPFDADQRPINTDWMIDRFSGGGDDDRWGDIERTLWVLSKNHAGENGVIHTASYERAERLYEQFSDRAVCDTPEKDSETAINEWKDNPTKQLFLSPAVMDGVDLPDDACRWQVLLKVPYPSPADSRIDHLLNENGDWSWYYETTAQSIVQSAGRGVRHSDDYCTYYVLDACFEDVLDRAAVPQWFRDAIDVGEVRRPSAVGHGGGV